MRHEPDRHAILLCPHGDLSVRRVALRPFARDAHHARVPRHDAAAGVVHPAPGAYVPMDRPETTGDDVEETLRASRVRAAVCGADRLAAPLRDGPDHRLDIVA